MVYTSCELSFSFISPKDDTLWTPHANNRWWWRFVVLYGVEVLAKNNTHTQRSSTAWTTVHCCLSGLYLDDRRQPQPRSTRPICMQASSAGNVKYPHKNHSDSILGEVQIMKLRLAVSVVQVWVFMCVCVCVNFHCEMVQRIVLKPKDQQLLQKLCHFVHVLNFKYSRIIHILRVWTW